MLDRVIVVHLLPENATHEEMNTVVEAAWDKRQSILRCIDDAKVLVGSGLTGSKAMVWGEPGRWPASLGDLLGVPYKTMPFDVRLRLRWPTDYRPAAITHPYGEPRDYRREGHEGVDIRTGMQGKILSATDGVVFRADGTTYPAYGNCIVVASGKYRIFYGHLSVMWVCAGQAVKAGDVLGVAGNTGNSQGVHLHFGVRDDQGWIDPTPLLIRSV